MKQLTGKKVMVRYNGEVKYICDLLVCFSLPPPNVRKYFILNLPIPYKINYKTDKLFFSLRIFKYV